MIADQQVKKLFSEYAKEHNCRRSALKSDICAKTARKYLRAGRLPSEMRKAHRWRTRADPFAELHEEINGILDINEQLPATEVLSTLQRRYPGRVRDGQLRTMQRRLRTWRAVHVSKEVFFEQVYEPGEWLQVDWTRADGLRVTIAGDRFEHKLCHAMFPFSNWEWATPCTSENFASLQSLLRQIANHADGLPDALQMDNSCTITHRVGAERVFNHPFQALLDHNSLTARTINIRKPHENGVIESAHRHFIRCVDAALSIRNSRDFDSVDQYNAFLTRLLHGRNAARQEAWSREKRSLHTVPKHGLPDVEIAPRRVNSGSLVSIDNGCYSVPSSYIGERLSCRIGLERIELFYADELLRSIPRAYDGEHRIDWRHLIGWLVRKPGAFGHYKYRDAFFPAEPYRAVYARIVQADPADAHNADKRYLALLSAAAQLEDPLIETAFELLTDGPDVPDARLLPGCVQPLIRNAPADLLNAFTLTSFTHLLADTTVGEAQHNTPTSETLDRGHGHHFVLEDTPPLAEYLIAAQHDTALLAARTHELEKHLHLLTPVLNIPQLIDINHVETAQTLQLLFQTQLLLRHQQSLEQDHSSNTQDLVLMAQHQFPAECLQIQRLPSPRQAEGQNMFAFPHKTTLKQAGQHAAHTRCPQCEVGAIQRLGRRQVGSFQQPLNASLLAVLELGFAQLCEELSVTALPGLSNPDLLVEDRRHGRQPETFQIHTHCFIHRPNPPQSDHIRAGPARKEQDQIPHAVDPQPCGTPQG